MRSETQRERATTHQVTRPPRSPAARHPGAFHPPGFASWAQPPAVRAGVVGGAWRDGLCGRMFRWKLALPPQDHVPGKLCGIRGMPRAVVHMACAIAMILHYPYKTQRDRRERRRGAAKERLRERARERASDREREKERERDSRRERLARGGHQKVCPPEPRGFERGSEALGLHACTANLAVRRNVKSPKDLPT